MSTIKAAGRLSPGHSRQAESTGAQTGEFIAEDAVGCTPPCCNSLGMGQVRRQRARQDRQQKRRDKSKVGIGPGKSLHLSPSGTALLQPRVCVEQRVLLSAGSTGPFPCLTRPGPVRRRFQDADSALTVPPSPQREAHSQDSGGSRVSGAGDTEVLSCLLQVCPQRQGLQDRTDSPAPQPQVSPDPCAQVPVFHRRVPSRSVVLGFADHGSAGQPLGAAAARRVQLQLRGVAAGVQRAHLSAAARAAPAGAQDAAGQPGAELQVQGQLAGSGDTPGEEALALRRGGVPAALVLLLAQFQDRPGITATLSGETPYWRRRRPATTPLLFHFLNFPFPNES